MREVDVEELLTTATDPFVRHQLDPARTQRAWVHGEAVLAATTALVGLGPAADLDPLLAEAAPLAPARPRVMVEEASYAALPAAWRPRQPRTWHWMLTRRPAPPAPTDPVVVEVDDPAEVDAVLDAGNPGSHARPDTPGIEAWLGIRDGEGCLLAVGALARQADGTGHLRGVTVRPGHTGRGLGRVLSAALTQRALAGRSRTATLGVYTDNAPALAVYARLGYRTLHTFASGAVPEPVSP